MDNSQQTLDETAAPNPVPAATTPPKQTRSGLASASLVIGILALIGAFIPFVNYGSGLLAVVGAVLGLVALIQKRAKGTATAGLTISVIAVVLSVIMAIAYTASFAASVADSVDTNSVAAAPAADAEPAEAPAEPAEPEASAIGTRENPAPIGTPITLGATGAPEWEISLGAPTLNAAAEIAAENQFNEAAAPGFQYAMLPVNVKYVGPTSGNPSYELTFKFVSAAGTTHEEYDQSVVTPNDLSNTNDMYPGATATGNISIMVPSADIEKGTWSVAGSMFSEDFFFAAQ